MTKHKKLLPVKSFAFQIIELYQAGLGWAGLGWAGWAGDDCIRKDCVGAH